MTVFYAPKTHLNSIRCLTDDEVWTLTVLESVGGMTVEKAAAKPDSICFVNVRVQINNPSSLSSPVQSVAHLFLIRPETRWTQSSTAT